MAAHTLGWAPARVGSLPKTLDGLPSGMRRL